MDSKQIRCVQTLALESTMPFPTAEELKEILGDDFLVRPVGSNFAIEPKLTGGQTDEDRETATIEAKDLIEAEVDGVSFNITQRTMFCLWVNQPAGAAVNAAKAENKALREELEAMRAENAELMEFVREMRAKKAKSKGSVAGMVETATGTPS